MNKLLVALFTLLTSTAYCQQNNFTLSGNIMGLDSDFIIISFKDTSVKGGSRRDSIKIKDNAFFYSGFIEEMTMMSVRPGVERVVKRAGSGYYPAKSSLLQFIAFPGAAIKFSGKISDFVDAYPSGDEANNDLAKLNKAVFPLMNESVNYTVKIANSIITNSKEIKKAKAVANELNEKAVAIKTQFIANNLSSTTSAWLLSDMMIRSQISNENAALLFSRMDKTKLVSIPFYTDVAKRVDGYNATGVGKKVPQISSLNTYDGKRFDLSSLKGKYVVLDFWGTWCGPCISGMPKMKEYLKRYKNKLEIVGIAQESDNGESWKKFLNDKPEYQWHHVLSRNNENYILKFNVAGFPTKIIVDPQGKIFARFVGEDDEIYNKLDEILK